MKLSTTGYIIIAVTLIVAFLRLFLGEVPVIGGIGIVAIGFFILSALLVIVSYQVYVATRSRKVAESKTWIFIFAGSIACFLLSTTSLFRTLIPTLPQSFALLSQILSVACYLCMIIGFIFSLRYFKGEKKTNTLIPIIVISIISAFILFFLFRMYSTSTFGIGMTVSFAIFVLFDALMLYLSWMNASLTWGGKFARSYVVIAIGFVLLVGAHIQLIFTSLKGIPILPTTMVVNTPLFIVAVGILALGCNARLSIEKELEI